VRLRFPSFPQLVGALGAFILLQQLLFAHPPEAILVTAGTTLMAAALARKGDESRGNGSGPTSS